MIWLERSPEGVWLTFGDGKYEHDAPRPATLAEIELWGQLDVARELLDRDRDRWRPGDPLPFDRMGD